MNKISRIIEVPFKKPEQVLSFSSIKDWKSCRQQWYYKRVRKLERRTKPLPLKKGTIVHDLLETYLKGENWRDKLPPIQAEYDQLMEEEKEYYGNLPEDCERIVAGYIKHWKDNPVKTLAVELSFGEGEIPALEITEGVYLRGRIDWIFQNDLGIWVCDHKTVGKRIPNESFRMQDLQTIIYARALPMLGYPKPIGVVFDYLKTKLPSPPILLKNNTISKSTRVSADYDTFLKAVLDNGQDPQEYQAQLEIAKHNKFYERKFLGKPKVMSDSLVDELKTINLEIKYLKDHPTRNLRRECEYCSYYSLCTAELMGLDTDFILKSEYVEKVKEVAEEDDDEEEEKDNG